MCRSRRSTVRLPTKDDGIQPVVTRAFSPAFAALVGSRYVEFRASPLPRRNAPFQRHTFLGHRLDLLPAVKDREIPSARPQLEQIAVMGTLGIARLPWIVQAE